MGIVAKAAVGVMLAGCVLAATWSLLHGHPQGARPRQGVSDRAATAAARRITIREYEARRRALVAAAGQGAATAAAEQPDKDPSAVAK